MRQLAITAQRHREQDELRSQAQLNNTGPSQTGIRDSESISSRSDIRLSIPEADTRIGHPNRSQIPEHEGMQFEPELGNSDDEDDDDELLDNESDFDAEPRVDDRRPCTPNDPSSGEEDFGEGSSMDGGDDLIDEQLFIPRSALFNPYQLGDIDEEDDETVDSLAEIHPAIINTYIRAFVSATFKVHVFSFMVQYETLQIYTILASLTLRALSQPLNGALDYQLNNSLRITFYAMNAGSLITQKNSAPRCLFAKSMNALVLYTRRNGLPMGQ